MIRRNPSTVDLHSRRVGARGKPMTRQRHGLTLAEAAAMMRDAVKDKSYRAFPLGQEAGHYLRAKRKRLTPSSYRDYESCLDKLARHFLDLEIGDLEPPVGTERLEEFLDAQWGEREGRTYNKNLSILRDFFKWAVLAASSTATRRSPSSARRSETFIARPSPRISGERSSPHRTTCATASASSYC